MSKELTPEDRRHGIVNLLGSVAWGAITWGFAWLVGAPHWACWLFALVSWDAQSNASGIRYRLKKLLGGESA